MEESQKARAEAETREHMRVTLLEERLQGAGKVFEENKLLTTERNALKAALLEEQIRNEKRLRREFLAWSAFVCHWTGAIHWPL